MSIFWWGFYLVLHSHEASKLLLEAIHKRNPRMLYYPNPFQSFFNYIFLKKNELSL